MSAMPCKSSSPAATQPSTQPASKPAVGVDQVLLQFQTFDCACSLGDVQFALMDLYGVKALDWDYHAARFVLTVDSQVEPNDAQIRGAIAGKNVTLQEIVRP